MGLLCTGNGCYARLDPLSHAYCAVESRPEFDELPLSSVTKKNLLHNYSLLLICYRFVTFSSLESSRGRFLPQPITMLNFALVVTKIIPQKLRKQISIYENQQPVRNSMRRVNLEGHLRWIVRSERSASSKSNRCTHYVRQHQNGHSKLYYLRSCIQNDRTGKKKR